MLKLIKSISSFQGMFTCYRKEGELAMIRSTQPLYMAVSYYTEQHSLN